MFLRFTLALLCLAMVPCTAYSQVQIIQGPNGPQIVPQQQQYTPQQQYIPQQQYSNQQQYVPQQNNPCHRIPGGWVSNDVATGVNSQTGGIETANSQYADSAFINGREQGKANRRWERRPVYGANGQVTGYQEGYVWKNIYTGQEHFDMTSYTPNNFQGIHTQTFSVQGQADGPVYRPGVPRL